MNFRNVMFLISITIIGFCFTLYFQSDVDVQSINFEQYKNLNYTESRSLSLQEFNEQISPLKLEDIIQEIYSKNKAAGEKTRIMEIGAENGRMLMELDKIFPEIEFYAINKEKTMTFYRRESFILTALKFEIYKKDEIDEIDVPYVVFQDLDFGADIPYDDNKFDLIYSQSVIPLIKYKFELLNEVLRVLKIGGISLHANVSRINVYASGIVLSFRDALREMRKMGLEIYPLEGKNGLRFKRTEGFDVFPVEPHHPLPLNTDSITTEQRRPEMGYNLIFRL